MSCGCSCNDKNNNDFKLANISSNDNQIIKELEDKLKMEIGKDIVLIAWEKK